MIVFPSDIVQSTYIARREHRVLLNLPHIKILKALSRHAKTTMPESTLARSANAMPVRPPAFADSADAALLFEPEDVGLSGSIKRDHKSCVTTATTQVHTRHTL